LKDVDSLRRGLEHVTDGEASSDLLLQQAVFRMMTRDLKGARTSLEQALKAKPDDTRVLSALNQWYGSQNDTKRGVEALQDYASKHTDSSSVQEFVGTQLKKQGLASQARKAFEAARKADPNSVEPQLSLAELDLDSGDLKSARERLLPLSSAHKDN